jgi:hypothetical protein
MRIRSLLATTALIAVATSTTASAQSAAPRSKVQKRSTAASRVNVGSGYLRTPTTRSAIPPAPPVPYRASRRLASSHRSDFDGMMGTDNSGRTDHSGHPVRFYSPVRGQPTTGAREFAAKSNVTPPKPRENPQKVQF